MKITRDELLIAAFKLFMSVNYEKASFAELGKMLGMSKAGNTGKIAGGSLVWFPKRRIWISYMPS